MKMIENLTENDIREVWCLARRCGFKIFLPYFKNWLNKAMLQESNTQYKPISEVNWSTRVKVALMHGLDKPEDYTGGYKFINGKRKWVPSKKTLYDLSLYTESELLSHRNFGKKSLNEIINILCSVGLELKK